MTQWLKDLFSENSSVSMMRVMSFIVCLCACKLALSHGDLGMVTAMLGIAFGGKVTQKIVEKQK